MSLQTNLVSNEHVPSGLAPNVRDELERHQLLCRIAEGGMAQIHVALATRSSGQSQVVAVKRLRPEHAKNQGYVEMFGDEIRLANRLRHPNVPRVFGSGKLDGLDFISMEYLAGEDLLAILSRTSKKKIAIPVDLALAVIAACASALDHAHELRDERGQRLGIVHRDVSPSNVVVTYDGETKLLDFGIAKSTDRQHETCVGIFKGKLWYSAPEQLVGEVLDRRTDVFCLGIIFWELLAGRRLFTGTELSVAEQIRTGLPVAPSTVRPELDAKLDRVVTKALARDPAQRFQSAAELGAAIEELVLRLGASTGPDAVARWLRTTFGEARAELKLSVRAGLDLGRDLPRLLALSAPADDGPGAEAAASNDGGVLEPKAAWSNDAAGGIAWVPEESSGARAIAGVLGRRPASRAPSRTEERRVSSPGVAELDEGPRREQHSRRALVASVIVALGLAPALVILFGGTGRAPSPELASLARTIAVESDPSGAVVFVDGEPTGLVTPALVPVSANRHGVKIRVEHPGWVPAERVVSMEQAGREGPIRFSLESGIGRVHFDRIPVGAQVFVDGRPLTALHPAELPVGAHEVHVERGGELLFEGRIDVRAGDQSVDVRGRSLR
ncbi:protein kinase [Myxococcota bacterium]|nr:protein kinase [Myxococcota bacterium]